MSDTRRGLVVGTAGHIDHGKTSMVRTLTGVDLDRLPEEQERGITIALGFTALDLPDGRQAALVDVPGHERLIRTMVAGATGIDAVVLCVSAVDGVMPQTREHLAILRLLGVEHGFVVLTMADLVDEELLELAVDDVADAVTGTFLEGRPIIPFSAVTSAGRTEVLDAMATLSGAERTQSGPFRLPVDRTFVRPGFGTVATGTAWSGQLADGSAVTLLPSEQTARVRGIQSHGSAAEVARAGHRIALNLAGVEKAEVPRGTVVTSGDVPCALMIDVTYHHLASSPPLDDGAPVRVLLGTAECIGNIHAAADVDELSPGLDLPAQLRLASPLPCLPGDRFVIRRTSPLETLGGGVVVDPWASRMRKRNRVPWGEQIERLQAGETSVWLDRAEEIGLSETEWKQRSGGSDHGELLGDRRFSPTIVVRLEGALLEALAEYHNTQALSLGAHRRELRRGRLAHLPDRVFDALVDRLSDNKAVQLDGPLVRIAGFSVQPTAAQENLKAALERTIRDTALAGIAPKDLHKKHPEPEVSALVRLIEQEGTAEQVSGIGWVSLDALDGLRSQVRDWFAGHEVLTPGEFKDLTGLTRKSAIPLLEWLDRNRVTRRGADGRLAGSALTR